MSDVFKGPAVFTVKGDGKLYPPECQHKYEYAGIRYCDGRRNLPGGGATQRYYAHVYFCTLCLRSVGQPIKSPLSWDGRPLWNSYQKPMFNATPGSQDECGVPLEDR